MNDNPNNDLAATDRSAAELASAGGARPLAVLITFIFSLAVVQGVTINLMPLLFRTMARAFELNLRQEGQLQTAFLAGGIIGLFVSGYATEILRAKKSGLLTILAVGLGSLMLGFGTTYRHVLAAAFVIGLGNMSILAVYSAVITEHFAEMRQRMFMWTTAVFAGSAAVGNMMFGYLLANVSPWNQIFVVFAVLIWLWFGALTLLAGKRLDVTGKRFRPSGSPATADSEKSLPLWESISRFLFSGIFNRGVFWMLGFLVLLDNLAAGNIVAWTGRYFQLKYDVGDEVTGTLLAAIAAGVLFGRLVLGTFISGRFSDRIVLGTCYGLGILMYVLILVIPSYQIGMVLAFLSGAFIAAQAPTMYSIASVSFGARAATAIPLMDAIGVLGGFSGPTILGALADESDLQSVLWLVPMLGAVFVAVVFVWDWIERRRGGTSPSETAPTIVEES